MYTYIELKLKTKLMVILDIILYKDIIDIYYIRL